MSVTCSLVKALLFSILLFQSHAFVSLNTCRKHQLHRHFVRLDAKNTKLGRKEGVYVRPSAAIERGSGFFIPGLEGPKVRLASGIVLICSLVFIVTNSPASNAGNTFANGLTAVFATIVLLQAAIEYQKESGSQIVTLGSSVPSTVTWKKQWLIPSTDTIWRERVEWAASSFLSLTAATNIVLVGPGNIVFSLGIDNVDAIDPNSCLAALDTLAESKSGRVAVPLSHPSVALFAGDVRCIILQRISEQNQLCWIVSSNQLLASFTKQDLTWLGRMAEYVDAE